MAWIDAVVRPALFGYAAKYIHANFAYLDNANCYWKGQFKQEVMFSDFSNQNWLMDGIEMSSFNKEAEELMGWPYAFDLHYK